MAFSGVILQAVEVSKCLPDILEESLEHLRVEIVLVCPDGTLCGIISEGHGSSKEFATLGQEGLRQTSALTLVERAIDYQ